MAFKASLRGALAVLVLVISIPAALSAPPPSVDPAVLARIRDAALQDGWAYPHLAELTDSIGPRLSGSAGLEAAVDQVASLMRTLGARVSLQPTLVPHWTRGVEQGALVRYPGQPRGVTQGLHLTALGDSGATVPEGVTADVMVVHSVEELSARSAEVRGRIVLINRRFNQHLADNGYAGQAYGEAGEARFVGPMTASKLGAVATLVRSVGHASYRLPHTGATDWDEGEAPAPAAAVTAEDADLIDRLAARGPVTAHVTLTPTRGVDTPSANVVADWPGREHPEEVVVVGGHLDSWDLGTGAVDDGAGVMSTAAVIETLARLNLHPRRTIRFVAFTNEENGGRGGLAYAAAVRDGPGRQVAAIECDLGAGRALGVQAAVTAAGMTALKEVAHALEPMGATVLVQRDGVVGSDIRPLQQMGVPGFAPLLDARHYFDYHHTAADTLDKVKPEELRSQVATLAVLAYFLAESSETLVSVPVQKGE